MDEQAMPQEQKQPEMTVEQALQNLANVTAEVKATRNDHLIIQLSLQTLAKFIAANRKTI
jgi:hypothetical protein